MAAFISATNGWIPDGIGNANAYPSGYLYAPLLLIAHYLVGSLGTLFLLSVLCAVPACLISAKLCRTFNIQSTVVFGSTVALLLFNPWTYTQVVAGHLFMIIACGALTAIFLEALEESPNWKIMSVWLIASLAQLQFFVCAFALVCAACIVHRRYFAAYIGALVALPIFSGLAAGYSSLLATPFNLSWQMDQSIPLSQSVLLSGYFTNYDLGFLHLAKLALIVECGLVFVGVIAARGAFVVYTAAAAGALGLLVASGLKGPLALPYALAALHFPAVALFRELYDLIGISASAYVIVALSALRRFPLLRFAWFLCAGSLLAAWILRPPSTFWVDAGTLPRIRLTASENSRFALLPPFQPLRYGEKGSGADPDAVPVSQNVTPLNEYLSGYPETVALAAAGLPGSTWRLSALSVSQAPERPWLSTDARSLSRQGALNAPLSRDESLRPLVFKSPLPELTLQDVPEIASLLNQFGTGNVLFADAAMTIPRTLSEAWGRQPEAIPVQFSRESVNAQDAWVDARGAFAQHPEFGQPFGGALTTSSTAGLKVASGLPLLVGVQGSLLDAKGRPIQGSTHGFKWVFLPRDASPLRCHGLCLVATQASFLPNAPLNRPPKPYVGIKFHAYFPFFIVATLPRRSMHVLRYNVRFDAHWAAFLRMHVLPHFRIDGIVNGWFLGNGNSPEPVLLIETVALAQALLEVAVIVTLLVWGSMEMLKFQARRGRNDAAVRESGC